MEYKTRSYPQFSACGLNCGLCPRYYTVGSSRCPGCAAENFSEVHPTCGVLSCCQRKDLEYCFECDEYPCKKYKSADLADSFITYRNQFRDMDKAKRVGIETYAAELNVKMDCLKLLLEKYDDGRRKGFYCLAVNLLDLMDIAAVMERIEIETNPSDPVKEKAKTAMRLFQAVADERNITLKLRKN